MYLKATQATPGRSGIPFSGRLSGPDEAEDTLIRIQAKLGLASCLGKIENCVTEFIFNLRHPERRGAPLPPLKSASAKERPLIQEWLRTRNVVRPWLQGEMRGLQHDAQNDKRLICESITTHLKDLEDSLLMLSDPKRANLDQSDISRTRNFVGRLVGDLTVSFEIYAAIGCTTPDLSLTEARVQKMLWPKDQAMQGQRARLVEAIRKVQQKSRAGQRSP